MADWPQFSLRFRLLIKLWSSFILSCPHGGHRGHVLDWRPRHPGAVEPSLMARPGALEPSLMAHRGSGEPLPGEGVVEPASFYSPQVGEGGCMLSRPSSPLSCSVVRRRTPLALDLFCGSNSVGARPRELGVQVVSVVNRPSKNPTFCVDILTGNTGRFSVPGILR